MPTFNDLYYTDIGNKYLKPEFTEQYNVGAVYNKMFNHNFFKYFNIQADGYYNKVTNKIIAYPTGQQFRWTMLNLGEVRIIGVDVAAQLSCQLNNVGIHARLNYTWQKAQDYTEPDRLTITKIRFLIYPGTAVLPSYRSNMENGI